MTEEEMQEGLKRRWQTKTPWKIRRLYGGEFLVLFPNKQWLMETVENKGNENISWKKWTQETTTWPVGEGEHKWIELTGIPLDLWEEKSMEEVVKSFGKIIEIHKDTQHGRFLEAAKVKVAMWDNATMPAKVQFKHNAKVFWIGIHENKQRKMKQAWIEVVRGRPHPQEGEEVITTRIDKDQMGEERELEIGRKSEKTKNKFQARGKTPTEEEDEEESPDPFHLWEHIGKPPKKNRRLWEKMGELVAEEFQSLKIQSSPTKPTNTERDELPREERAEPQATEEFLKQLKETEHHSEGESDDTEKRAEEEKEEIYSPSTYLQQWGDDSWTRETILDRSQEVGIQVQNNQEKIVQAWEDRKHKVDRWDTQHPNQ